MEKPSAKDISYNLLLLSDLIEYWKQERNANETDEQDLINRLYDIDSNLVNGVFYLNLEPDVYEFDSFLVEEFPEETTDNFITFMVDTE